MKIWANTIVNNEENFIWFAVMSVINHVDKILIWDTGSTDKTLEIIREIRRIEGDKVNLIEIGPVDKFQFPKVRQKMLEESHCDWILILDGDEIWWEESIKKLVEEIHKRGDKIEGVVVPMVVPVGDIYHLQEEKAGKYHLLGKRGHLSLRAIDRRISGLHVDLPYGKESYLDENNLPIQKRKNVIFLNAPYLHVTHLKRSNQKRKHNKFKYEIGYPVSSSFQHPEVFYKKYPSIIPSPWSKLTGIDRLKANILTPLRKLKRRLI